VLCIRTWVDAPLAGVSVRDNGIGIPPERMAHLFDPFYTTKSSGMGMGLPISQTIMENHGGEIWAESDSGSGTTFFVNLPLAGAEAAGDEGGVDSDDPPLAATA
jgi:two-component system sensor kinase FixL